MEYDLFVGYRFQSRRIEKMRIGNVPGGSCRYEKKYFEISCCKVAKCSQVYFNLFCIT